MSCWPIPRLPTDDILGQALTRLHEVYSADQPDFLPVLDELVAHRSAMRRPGGGWVLDSFWSAWSIFATAASYRQTIERAVRLGHDTDTTAAIAGGLAGLRWGSDERGGGIPADWLKALRGKDIVEPLIARLV